MNLEYAPEFTKRAVDLIPSKPGTVIRTRNHPSNNARVYERRDAFWWETGDEVPLLPEQVQHVVDIYDFDIIYRP